MAENLTDTDKKTMRTDHDLLTIISTQVAEVMRRLDGLSRDIQDTQKQNYIEFRDVAVNHVALQGEITAIKGDLKDTNDHLDALESKSFRFDLIIGFATILGTIIAVFFK